MPVTVLFCEGVRRGADHQVLNKLLIDDCRIEPAGSKHAMDTLILRGGRSRRWRPRWG